VSADDLLLTAASVEQNSEHPLAAAMVRGAKDRNVKLHPVTDLIPSLAASRRETWWSGNRCRQT